jgi:hypothetical protein
MDGLLGFVALAAADDHRAAVLKATAWELNDRLVFSSEAPVYERVEQRFIAPARRAPRERRVGHGERRWA